MDKRSWREEANGPEMRINKEHRSGQVTFMLARRH